MTAWLYVLELSPTGHIKIGQTQRLGARLTQHERAARYSGGQIARTFSVAVADGLRAERELLAALLEVPSIGRAHGKEFFAGVGFARVVALAERAAGSGGPASVGLALSSHANLVADCRAVLESSGRAHLRDLSQALSGREPAKYAALTTAELGRALRGLGVPTPVLKLRGRVTSGVRLDDLNVLPATC